MKRNPVLVSEPIKVVIDLCIGITLVVLIVLTPIILLLAVRRDRRVKKSTKQSLQPIWYWLSRCTTVGAILAIIDALLVEPNVCTVTRLKLPLPAMPVGKRLRIVHLSDLHIVGPRNFFRRMIARVAKEAPDLIVITGDLLQCPQSSSQRQYAGDVFQRLSAIAPIVMIPGGHDESPIPTAPSWIVLKDEVHDLEVGGVPTRIIGWDDEDGNPHWYPPAHTVNPDRVNILLTHSPDWFDHAAALGADLALAGHTHGGQVRLPLWGAVVTSSIHGKRFEYGAYRLGKMRAFVTRGIGQNPWPTPPMRFLCPPEIAVLTLQHGE